MCKIELLGHTCIGASHIVNGKPCQDHSLHKDYGDWQMLIVSDGHGDDKYFRSDRGSKIAVEVTQNAIESFVQAFNVPSMSIPLCQRGISGVTNENLDDYTPVDYHCEDTFRHLFKFIISNWYQRITEDWANTPPTDEEYDKIDSTRRGKVKCYFNVPNPDLGKAYGCTLIAAVRTKDYWFAFQLGDGKCVAFREDGSWFEPIPWDSRCFLNKTTSLSGQGAESFRYCYGIDQVPALFIGSDGIDDSYAPMECLAKWYKLVLNKIQEHEAQKIQLMIEDFLPQLSRQGSKDDMSLQLWVDTIALPTLCKNIYHKDVIEKEEHCAKLKDEIANLRTDVFICKNNIEDCENKVDAFTKLINKGRERVDAIKINLSEIRQELSLQEDNLRTESQTLNTNIANKQSESDKLGRLKSDLDSKQIAISEKEHELEQIRLEIDNLKNFLSTNNNNNDFVEDCADVENMQRGEAFGDSEKSKLQEEVLSSVVYTPAPYFKPGDAFSQHTNDVPTKRETRLTIPVGGSFSYRAFVHSSVGIWWAATFDEDVFRRTRSFTSDNPESAGYSECGGDDAIVVETYTALCKGRFKVIVKHEFRGIIEHTEIFQVTVK